MRKQNRDTLDGSLKSPDMPCRHGVQNVQNGEREFRSQNGSGFKPEIMFSLCLCVFVREMVLTVLHRGVQNVQNGE